VHLDIGSGDGRGPYRWALREPERLFIASDANPDALLETAWKAGRKSSRGGVSNLLCVAEPLDVLAPALGVIADRVSVILPWGSLLETVAIPRQESLRNLAMLCLPHATIEIVLSYDERNAERLDEQHVVKTLPRLYQQAGLRITGVEKLRNDDLRKYETTWARRLAFGRSRDIWRILAVLGPVTR
jgi:16S rRNA (adenine(1408)-N(1))-methyltransferase